MNNKDRAVQFAPFASLRGYYDGIHAREEINDSKRELSEDEAYALSQTLSLLKKGDRVQVCFYNGSKYITVRGVICRISFPLREMDIGGKTVYLDSIIHAQRLDIQRV